MRSLFAVIYIYFCILILYFFFRLISNGSITTHEAVLMTVLSAYLSCTAWTYKLRSKKLIFLATIPLACFLYYTVIVTVPNIYFFIGGHELFRDSPATIIIVGIYFLFLNIPLLALAVIHWRFAKLQCK